MRICPKCGKLSLTSGGLCLVCDYVLPQETYSIGFILKKFFLILFFVCVFLGVSWVITDVILNGKIVIGM